MTKALVVYVTVPSRQEAAKIARALVHEKLAACVSAIPGVSSCFRWKGRMERTQEILLMIKTTPRRYPALEKRIRFLHSYKVPEILATPVVGGNAEYIRWLRKSIEK
jgi:periplasmic divalent cation tolerance protein